MHLFTILACAILIAACNTSIPQSESFAIPSLKPRVQALRGAEFAKIERQVSELRSRIAANEKDVDALGRLAVVYMNEARITGDHPYYYPAAMRLVDRALTFDPSNYVALVSKGSILLSLHQFNEALRVGEIAVKKFPANAIVYGILCDANVELGHYTAAIAAADRMVAIRPDLKSYSRVSYLREIHGDSDGAIGAMKLAVASGAPGSEEKAWCRTTLGTMLLANNRRDDARREFEMTLSERDRYPFAIAGLAKVARASGDDTRAMHLLDSAVALMPEFSFVEQQIDILREAGDARAADSLVGVVATMLGEDEAAGHAVDRELAMLYANNDTRISDALARARAELARRPDNIDAQHTMAWVLLKAGRAREAMRFIETARRTGSRSPDLIAHAVMIERAAGSHGG